MYISFFMTEPRLVKASVSITVCVSSLKPGLVRLNTLCIYNYADIYAISLKIAFANTTAHTHTNTAHWIYSFIMILQLLPPNLFRIIAKNIRSLSPSLSLSHTHTHTHSLFFALSIYRSFEACFLSNQNLTLSIVIHNLYFMILLIIK